MKRIIGRALFIVALLCFRAAYALAGKPLRKPCRLKAAPVDRYNALVKRGQW